MAWSKRWRWWAACPKSGGPKAHASCRASFKSSWAGALGSAAFATRNYACKKPISTSGVCLPRGLQGGPTGHLWQCGQAAQTRLKTPCIAGVGGNVARLLKTARPGRSIIALDGCPLVWVKSALARHGIGLNRCCQLQQYGVKKRQHEHVDLKQVNVLLEPVTADLLTKIPSAKPSFDMTYPSLHQAFNSSAPSP